MAVTDQTTRAVMYAIQEQMKLRTFFDVTISVKERTFECHRFLLSACSKFFREIFSSDTSKDFNRDVEIKKIDPETFSLIIDCIYKGKNVVNPDNLTSVWRAAHHLQIDFLIENCEVFQIQQLSKDNCVDIFVNAKLLDSISVLEMSWMHILKDFENLRKTEAILMLDFDDMMKLVADETLVVSSEDLVIETIIRWVNFVPDCAATIEKEQPSITFTNISTGNRKECEKEILIEEDEKDNKEEIEEQKSQNKEAQLKLKQSNQESINTGIEDSERNQKKKLLTNRKEYLPSLLKAAKICLISSPCIQALTENKMVLDNPKALAIVLEGLRYQLQPGRRQDYCSPYAIYRSSSPLQNVTVAICNQGGQVIMSCRTLDGMWYQLTVPIAHLNMCKAVTYDNDIYATCTIGYQFAYKYDSTSNTWRQLTNLSVVRNAHALICLGDYIYAVGGNNITSIERFNAKNEKCTPGSGRWEIIGNLTHAVSNIVVTSFGSNIVIFGSAKISNSSTVIQSFDTQTYVSYNYPDGLPDSINNMVTFKQADNTFLLQETGALWKLVTFDKFNLNLELLGRIWNFPVELSAAVICNQELLVLGKTIGSLMSHEWDTSKYSEFKHIKILERNAFCFLNIVINKTLLNIKDA